MVHSLCYFPTLMALFESECSTETVSASWSDVLSISTVCDAPPSLGHHSTHCSSGRRGIFHNYTLGHLLDLGHHSRRVPVRNTRWMETQLTHCLHLSLKVSTAQPANRSHLQPKKTLLAQTIERDSSWSRLLLETPGFTVGKLSMFLSMNSLRANHCLLVSQ